MASNASLILNTLYPIVEKSLDKKENITKFNDVVNKFLDRNNEKLTTLGPIHRIIFSNDDKERLYDVLGLSPIQIKDAIKKSTYIKSSWKKIADPFFIASVLAIRYGMMKKNEDFKFKAIVYFTMGLYPSLHFKYFKFEPNENIMEYTVNNLSNKYKIKQMGSIYNALLDTTLVSHENEKEDLIKCTDKDVVDYVNSAQTRMNSILKNISDEYYKNHKNQNYLNLEEDKNTEDEFRIADSNIFSVDKVTNRVVLKLLVDGPSIRLIDFSAKICTVSINELRNYIQRLINNDNRQEIKLMIENILFLYIYNSQNKVDEIGSNKFVIYCLELYKKSNTGDKNILKIKEILDKWMTNIDIYKKTQRLATINDFRRAIFLFFVFTIQNADN